MASVLPKAGAAVNILPWFSWYFQRSSTVRWCVKRRCCLFHNHFVVFHQMSTLYSQCESGTDSRLTEDNNICWWDVMGKFLSGKNTWPVFVSTAARKMWQTRFNFFFPQAPSPTYRGLSPSTRRYTHADVREPSWRWSAIFTPPGVSRNTTSVTAGGWETAACGFPSATPGSAAEASPRRGCARLGSRTRRCISTGLTATGSPKWKQTKNRCTSYVSTEMWVQAQNSWQCLLQLDPPMSRKTSDLKLQQELLYGYIQSFQINQRAFIENRDFWVYFKV